MHYNTIDKCRVCGNRKLVPILTLPNQYLSGVFPNTRDHLDSVTSGPLDLIKCHDYRLSGDCCGLLQLRQSYDLSEMFGSGYGYRSSLNRSMIDHLHNKVHQITGMISLHEDDYVIDIGSNDSTLLQAYPQIGLNLIGFDPVADFKKYYPPRIRLIPDFFSAMAFKDEAGNRKAKIITSIAMFYDLENPLRFMQEVYSILDDEGIWVTEQSYMPAMLDNRAYDTICHEHLEYYGLTQIKWMADRAGFRILDVEFNQTNGGSFSVSMVKSGAPYVSAANIDAFIAEEEQQHLELSTLKSYFAFAAAVERSKQKLCDFLDQVNSSNKRICGLGASTKGNVILQHCGITERDLPFIGDVNPDKFGCFTPGSRIPIIPEAEILAMKPDYLLVLPWHFRSFFQDNSKYAGAQLVFPLPTLSVH